MTIPALLYLFIWTIPMPKRCSLAFLKTSTRNIWIMIISGQTSVSWFLRHGIKSKHPIIAGKLKSVWDLKWNRWCLLKSELQYCPGPYYCYMKWLIRNKRLWPLLQPVSRLLRWIFQESYRIRRRQRLKRRMILQPIVQSLGIRWLPVWSLWWNYKNACRGE